MLGQLPLKQLHEQRLAGARRAAQDGRALSIFENVTQLEERALMGLARVIRRRVQPAVERLPLKLPVCFVHGRWGWRSWLIVVACGRAGNEIFHDAQATNAALAEG